MKLGDFIKNKARINSMSLSQLADKMNISLSLLSRICRGERKLTNDNMIKLIEVFDLDNAEIKYLQILQHCKGDVFVFEFIADEDNIPMMSMLTMLKYKYPQMSKDKINSIIKILEE